MHKRMHNEQHNQRPYVGMHRFKCRDGIGEEDANGAVCESELAMGGAVGGEVEEFLVVGVEVEGEGGGGGEGVVDVHFFGGVGGWKMTEELS